MRAVSTGSFGLWSSLSPTAVPPLDRTALESPAFYVNSVLFTMSTMLAVAPHFPAGPKSHAVYLPSKSALVSFCRVFLRKANTPSSSLLGEVEVGDCFKMSQKLLLLKDEEEEDVLAMAAPLEEERLFGDGDTLHFPLKFLAGETDESGERIAVEGEGQLDLPKRRRSWVSEAAFAFQVQDFHATATFGATAPTSSYFPLFSGGG